MRILIITPYLHKARQQLNRIITKRVNNGCTVVKAIADQYLESLDTKHTAQIYKNRQAVTPNGTF